MSIYKAQQVQFIKNPATGDCAEVSITQLFGYTPSVHYLRNGDPGEPESYDELGEPEIRFADTNELATAPWIDGAIDWDSFINVELVYVKPDLEP